jgi:hypothetical protein
MATNVCDRSRGSLYLVLSLLLLICLASCYPTFKNPIPPPAKLKADHRILGTWVRTTDKSGSKQQLCIFRRSSGWIDVVVISNIDSNVSINGPGINVFVLEGYSTFVNKQRFLCLRLREKDLKGRPRTIEDSYFLIVSYEIRSNGQLIMRPFSERKVKELIREGKLKGETVKQGQYVDKVAVTSPSDELVEAISKEGAAAFIGKDPNDIFVFSKGAAE